MREYHWTRVQSRVSGNFFSCFPFRLDPATLARAQRPATSPGDASRRFPPPRVAAEMPVPTPQRPRRRDEPPRPSQPLQIGVCARHRATQRPGIASLLARRAEASGSARAPARLVPPSSCHQGRWPSHPATPRPGPRPGSLDSRKPSATARAGSQRANRGLQKFARAFAKSLATGFANASSKSLLSPGSDGPAPRCGVTMRRHDAALPRSAGRKQKFTAVLRVRRFWCARKGAWERGAGPRGPENRAPSSRGSRAGSDDERPITMIIALSSHPPAAPLRCPCCPGDAQGRVC